MDDRKNRSVGIKIENGKDIRIQENITCGFDEGISAKNVDGLNASKNVNMGKPNGVPPRGRWIRDHLVQILVLVISGLIVAFLVFEFGWR